MSEVNFDYYNFRIKHASEEIKEEIDFFENHYYSWVPPLSEYVIYLMGRISTNKPVISHINHYDKAGNKCEIQKMNRDEYLKDIDIITYRRPWNKLKDVHKLTKIKEFVDELEYKKKIKSIEITKNREFLAKEIYNGLKNKKFGKNKSQIDYDQENRTITSISCIEYNKKTGVYDIDWDE